MSIKKNKRLPNQPGLVNNKDQLLEIDHEQQERIAKFFNPFEHYSDCHNMFLELQTCAFTSTYFKSLNEFEQEDLQLRFDDLVELVFGSAQPTFMSMQRMGYCFAQPLDEYTLGDAFNKNDVFTMPLNDYLVTYETVFNGVQPRSTITSVQSQMNCLWSYFGCVQPLVDYPLYDERYSDCSLIKTDGYYLNRSRIKLPMYDELAFSNAFQTLAQTTCSAWQEFPNLTVFPETTL